MLFFESDRREKRFVDRREAERRIDGSAREERRRSIPLSCVKEKRGGRDRLWPLSVHSFNLRGIIENTEIRILKHNFSDYF